MSRKLDFSKFNTSDDEGDDGLVLPKHKLDLTETKAKLFSQGNLRKSKKDLEREAEERKAKEEAEASAKALEEFTAAFEGDGVEYQPLGGMMGGFARRGRGGGGFVRAGGDPGSSSGQYVMGHGYAPPRAPAAMMPRAMRPPAAAFAAPPSPPRGAPKPKGQRAMDSFLEEIKKDQQIRDKRLGPVAKLEGSSVSSLAALERSKGATDVVTTNLFVSNLPGNVTEESLGMLFAEHGPVATVKIMWPRGEFDSSVGGSMAVSRRAKPGLTGFVAFMKRDDAEKAVRDLDGYDWAGCALRVGWGKPTPIPPRPLYEIHTGRGRSRSPKRHRGDDKRDRSRSRSDTRSRSPAHKRHRSRSRSLSPDNRRDSKKRSHSSSRSRSRSYSSRSRSRSPPRKKPVSARERYLAKVPEETEKFVKAVAAKVKQYGPAFEEMLLDKEKTNAKFAFLRDSGIPEYHMYKLALDSRYRMPSPPPFEFEDEGYNSVYSSDSAEESEREKSAKGKLGKLARKRFEACLRGMSGIRAEIARAMEFAMQKADAADEIAAIICESLRLEGTPVPRKMARLYLISDILHNSASPLPNVWKYRHAFESRLPPVFTHFCAVHRSLNAYSGRIAADVFKQQVLGMVEIWENWIVFTPGVTDKLRLLFDGATEASLAPAPVAKPVEPVAAPASEPAPSRFKKGGFKAAFVPVTAVPEPPVAAVEPADDLDGEAMDDEDLDGEAMEDMDGEAMDEDVDGEAM